MLVARTLIAAGLASALAGCQYLPWSGTDAPAVVAPVAEESVVSAAGDPEVMEESAKDFAMPADEPATPDAVPAGCGVLESRDWTAWIDRMPGIDASPKVHVAGKVVVRTGGFTFKWTELPLDRSAMPTLRLRLNAVPPDGVATGALTTHDVKYEGAALPAGYRGVMIMCGDGVLTEIAEIDTVE
jgi:hypothetical protein